MWRVAKIVALHDETPTARTITLEAPNDCRPWGVIVIQDVIPNHKKK